MNTIRRVHKEERSGLLSRLVSISGERRGLIENTGELFSEAYCPQCKNARGDREFEEIASGPHKRLERGG